MERAKTRKAIIALGCLSALIGGSYATASARNSTPCEIDTEARLIKTTYELVPERAEYAAMRLCADETKPAVF